MTKEQAIELADAFVKSNGLEVTSVEAVKKVAGSVLFPAIEGDIWVVFYRKDLPENVAEGNNFYVICVEEQTRHTYLRSPC